MGAHILLVEGKKSATHSCAPILEEHRFHVERVCTYRSTWAALEANPPDLLIVDTRRLRFNGLRLCETLIQEENPVPILLIIPEGQKQPSYPGVTILCGEPTARKLLYRVKHLLSPQGNHFLKAGEISLDLQKRVVIQKGEEHHLTPRLARLLEVFMRHPGRVLTRAFLMKEVWDTDYLGDTRTLDVHVHWLRKAIEEDYHHPRYLKTVRNVGYCFNVLHPRSPAGRGHPGAPSEGQKKEVDHRQTG